MTILNNVWETGRLDATPGNEQLLFGRMYEDSSIELNTFRQRGRILCIASAGCTAMELAPYHDEIVAVDINPLQISYVNQRLRGNIGFKGKAEQIMDTLRILGPIVGWWRSTINEFVELNLPVDQMYYWNKNLNTWRFRNVLDFIFSKRVLSQFYTDRLLNILPENLGAVMRKRMESCFSKHSNIDNPYIRLLLLGELNHNPKPIERHNVKLVNSDVLKFLEGTPPNTFNGFTLSNILDGADVNYGKKLFAEIKRTSLPGAMTVLRSFNDTIMDLKKNHSDQDRSMLWGSVQVIPVIDL